MDLKGDAEPVQNINRSSKTKRDSDPMSKPNGITNTLGATALWLCALGALSALPVQAEEAGAEDYETIVVDLVSDDQWG